MNPASKKLITESLQSSTSHGLPRVFSDKPIYIRIIWLLLFLIMTGFFISGLIRFVSKYRTNQTTTSLETNSVKFQFPDVYACFENPVSATYAAIINASAVKKINNAMEHLRDKIDDDAKELVKILKISKKLQKDIEHYIKVNSYLTLQSLPYKTLIDSLAQRMEQSLIDGYVIQKTEYGMPEKLNINAAPFYDPNRLLCIKWNLSTDLQDDLSKTGLPQGLFVTLLSGAALPGSADNSHTKIHPLYQGSTGVPMPISDWTMSLVELSADKRTGVRVFLTPPGEHPSDFVTSFSLGAGKYHTVEISMTQQVYKDGPTNFDCLSDHPDVQFVNPYDQTAYNNKYSYSYCYYKEYHRQYKELVNTSGYPSPLPWDFKGFDYRLNASNFDTTNMLFVLFEEIENNAIELCKSRRPCTTLDYTVGISSTDWPSESSVAPFVKTSIKEARDKAIEKDLSVPALEFLLDATPSNMASYVRNNILKVHFKPQRLMCDKIILSKEYGGKEFISDIGGIMGVYLGMSFLTLCELLELIYDLIAFRVSNPT